MLERALPNPRPKMTLGEDRPNRGLVSRPVSAGAVLHGIAGRLARVLRAVGAFFAAGGALS